MYSYKYAKDNKQTTNCPLSYSIHKNVKTPFFLFCFVLYLQHFSYLHVFMSPHIHTYNLKDIYEN